MVHFSHSFACNAYDAPILWNGFPVNIQTAVLLLFFRCKLKAHLFSGFLLFFYVVLGVVVKLVAVWQVVILDSDESFSCLPSRMKIKKFNSIKNNRVLSFYIKSLCCGVGIFAVINDQLQQPEGVCKVLV